MESLEALPLRVIVLPTGAVWSGPALATGCVLVCICGVTLTDA